MADGQKRVLIVEDEKPLSHALQLKLQHAGFEATIVENGEDCLKMVAAQKYDIILLDLMMPIMDGFQVLEKLQQSSTPPVVFVLSNLSQAEDEQRTLKLGARKYFIKSDTPLSVIVDEVKKI